MPKLQDTGGPISPLPPYVSYITLKRFIEDFSKNGVPLRIDKSVFSSASGTVQRQLFAALKYLKLVDENNRPNESLQVLARSYGKDEWPQRLREIIEASYSNVLALDLEKATSKQFQEHFDKFCIGATEVRKKCSRFFINAARDAEIKLSLRIISGMKPRDHTARPRANGRKQRISNIGLSKASPIAVYVSLFDSEKLNPEEQAAFLLLLNHLSRRHG